MKRDDGYATVMAVVLAALIGVVAAFTLVVADVVVTRQSAASAADLAALSASSHLLSGGSVTDACQWAQRSAQVARADIVSCDVVEADAVVEVRTAPSDYTRRLVALLSKSGDGYVHATARAGAPLGWRATPS